MWEVDGKEDKTGVRGLVTSCVHRTLDDAGGTVVHAFLSSHSRVSIPARSFEH